MTKKNYSLNEWTMKELTTYDDLYEVRKLINKGYTLCSIDTETTGLHIILDKAICISFTLVNLEELKGKAYVMDIRNRPQFFIDYLKDLFLATKQLVFWNAKFDLHMLYNIGMPLLEHPNITDAIIYARLANDAITPAKGGVDLSLKPYSLKNIDGNARDYEREVSLEKRKIVMERNKRIKDCGESVGRIEEFIKDKTNDVTRLPIEIQKILKDPKYEPNNYNNIPWIVLRKYAAFDAIFTIENYIRDKKIVEKRKQEAVVIREEKLIKILWEMERSGFKLNVLYLKQAKETVRKYILKRRTELYFIFKETVKISQHELIKKLFKEKYNVILEASDEDHLKAVKEPQEAKDAAEIIIELRTLEKWYSTYICKWDEYSDRTDRIYTSFKQAGAVSGRFSCDFQQFPKEPIYKKDGELLFSARRLVSVSGGNYDQLCLIDYAAEELRIQALYTMLTGKPDLNLCRAYMPMQCTEKDGVWYLNEDPSKVWKPTDLHTLTTLTAFPELSPDDPNFGHFRKIGKCTNFACNYNASKNTLMLQFGYPEDMAEKLYNAYNTVFPGVADYRKYVQNVLRYQDYITNLFDRRYYGCTWHNASNYLVQGSAADLLKIKLIQLYEFLKSHNYKSRMLCTIHDEIMFEIDKDEHDVVFELKKIMEDVPNSPIPFVAEISLTNTTWDMKKEIK